MKTNMLTSLLFVALVSCNSKKVDVKLDEEKIRYNLEDWQKLGATGDVDKIMTYWSDDAILMIPGLPPVNGKTAIRKMMEESKGAAPKMTWDAPSTIQVSESGDLAYVMAKNHIMITDLAGHTMTQDNKAYLSGKNKETIPGEKVLSFLMLNLLRINNDLSYVTKADKQINMGYGITGIYCHAFAIIRTLTVI